MKMSEVNESKSPSGKLLASIFTNVADMGKLKDIVSKCELEVSLLKPSLILDCFQLSIAAFKSSANYCNGAMKTKKIVFEVIYNLHPSKNIARIFRTLTPEDSDTTAIVLIHAAAECELEVKDFQNSIKGNEIPIDQVHLFSDIHKIKDMYGIKKTDLTRDEILGIVLAKMATKELD